MTQATPGLAVLIPAFREADRVEKTIRAVRCAVAARVVVADDGSDDGTAEAAERAGADAVVRLPARRGKGAALNAALAATDAPLLLLLDADLGDSASNVAPLVDAVRAGRCDMAIAAFPATGRKSGVGFAQGIARWGIRALTGRTLDAPLSGQRCLRREWVERLGGFAPGFSVEVALTLGVLAAGGTVTEIPLPLSHRKTGRTWAGWAHRARQTAAILRALSRAARLRGWGR